MPSLRTGRLSCYGSSTSSAQATSPTPEASAASYSTFASARRRRTGWAWSGTRASFSSSLSTMHESRYDCSWCWCWCVGAVADSSSPAANEGFTRARFYFFLPRPSLGPSDRKFKSWLSTISKVSRDFSRLSQGILLLHFFPLCLALILSGISNLEKLQICYDSSRYSFHFPVNYHPGAKISSQRKAITVQQIMSQKGYQCQRS